MVITCNIEWDDDNTEESIFYSGQTVSGRITLRNDTLEEIKRVILKVYGYEATNWVEMKHRLLSSKIRRTHSEYTGRKVYIDSITHLMGNESSDVLLKLEPGIHTYNFGIHIPANCSSSFEGEYGHTRYTVQVILQQNSSKSDVRFTKPITILKLLDLNFDTPLLRMPISSEIEKSCFSPCRYLPLKIDLHLEKSAFVPGQKIPIDVAVKMSNYLPDGELQVRLVMTVTYLSQEPTKHQIQKAINISESNSKLIALEGHQKYYYKLPIPATPPTCNNRNGLIQISYQVELRIKVKLMMIEEVVQAPVTIGNVPLLHVIEQQPQSGTNRSLNTILPWIINDNLTKPTYKKADHILNVKILENDHDGAQNEKVVEYSPKYAVFI